MVPLIIFSRLPSNLSNQGPTFRWNTALSPQTAPEVIINNWRPVDDNYMITLLTKLELKVWSAQSLLSERKPQLKTSQCFQKRDAICKLHTPCFHSSPPALRLWVWVFFIKKYTLRSENHLASLSDSSGAPLCSCLLQTRAACSVSGVTWVITKDDNISYLSMVA